MSPAVSAVVDAARDLAWRPTANTANAVGYAGRKEAHAALIAALEAMGRVRVREPELVYLLDAARRVARCSFSNRWGEPYYERREAVYQLRGCLDVWARSAGIVP